VNGAGAENCLAGYADYSAAMRIRRAAVTASIALLVLAGCGGGDDDSAETSAPSAGTGADAPTTTRAAGGGGGLGMGPETFARQLLVALRADSYTVDGTTITMEFTDGTTADAEAKCTIATATVGANATVILAYPDGEVPCE
jgi:ABC-type glycerol-3-phosphate transport system substrate-binding protein